MSKPINFFHPGEINANCYEIKYFYWENKIFYVSKLIGIFDADGLRVENVFAESCVGVIFPNCAHLRRSGLASA